MKANHPARIALTAFTLCLALAMLGTGGYFLYWYWRTGGTMSSTSATVTPHTAAELSTSQIGGRQPVPQWNLAGTGNIGGGRGNWHVNAGPYQMHIVQDNSSIAYVYHFTIQVRAAYTGDDQKLMDFAHQLTTNANTERDSGAPPAVIEKLRASPADWLTFELKMSDAIASQPETLWDQYVIEGNGSNHDKDGSALVQAVSDACRKAFDLNKADYTAAAAQVRAIISVDQEKQYRAAVAKATRAANARNPRPNGAAAAPQRGLAAAIRNVFPASRPTTAPATVPSLLVAPTTKP